MGAVSRAASVSTALVVAASVVAQSLTDSDVVIDACYLSVLVGASVAAWIGVGRWPSGRRWVPALIAAGVSLNALGEVVWTALVRSGANPNVSPADVAWCASYVFLCAALWTSLRRSQKAGRLELGFVVDAVTIVVISVLIFWRFTVASIVEDDTVSPFVRVVWSAYPVMDAVLLALVLRILMSRRARAAIDAWFAVGVCLWLAADILYIQLPDQSVAVTVMNSAWTVAPVLMARAAWRGRARASASEPVPTSSGGRGWLGQLLIAVCPLMVPPGLELAADLRGEPDRPMQLFVGMAAVIVLALVRTGRLIRSEQRAHRELELARDAALAASGAKSMFLANMSHEIRTPLTSVLATGELLNDTDLDDFQRKLVGMMQRSGKQLQHLVEGLLDFSRIEAGRASVAHTDFDLHELVTDIVEEHLPRDGSRAVSFDWVIDPGVPRVVVGDGSRVFQVLTNLIENAMKFTDQGRVHLDVRPVDRRAVQFAVSDTGIGIGEADQAMIFESFTQVDGTATRRYEGTGLGLAICKDLTELMGGTIDVHSEMGVGSTFTVRLPLAPAEQLAVAQD